MLNRWVRTWGCAVRTEHWLELDGLDFETGWVGMLLVFGSFHYMWHHVRFNSWNNQVFVYLPQIAKKCHCATITPIQKQSLQTKNPIIWAHAAIKCNGGHVNQKKGGEVWWIGNENNCAFSAVKLNQHQTLQMRCLDLWPAFWTTFFEQRECQVKTSLAWQVNFGNGIEWR